MKTVLVDDDFHWFYPYPSIEFIVALTCQLVTETSTQETKHHAWRAGELRFITPAGPEELTLQALSPKPGGYRAFIPGQRD